MALEIGATASITRIITDEDVRKFADVSGDVNPIHLDEDYAASTRFGQRIAHGMLSVSIISGILGNTLPGLGTIYLGQNIKFTAPVFIGDEVTATVELIKYREDKRIATFRTTCTKADGTMVMDGEATVIAPE